MLAKIDYVWQKATKTFAVQYSKSSRGSEYSQKLNKVLLAFLPDFCLVSIGSNC